LVADEVEAAVLVEYRWLGKGRESVGVDFRRITVNIVMGNDEFILYVRKQYPDCTTTNDVLGRSIWDKLLALDSNARIVERDVTCYWGHAASGVAADKLPQTATQFSFDRAVLPQLYDYLDYLGEAGAKS